MLNMLPTFKLQSPTEKSSSRKSITHSCISHHQAGTEHKSTTKFVGPPYFPPSRQQLTVTAARAVSHTPSVPSQQPQPPSTMPHALDPFPRPRPGTDDRATSDLLRQRDEAYRQRRIATGRQREPRQTRQPARQRIPPPLPRSPYPRQIPSDSVNLADWDDVAEEDDGNGIKEEDNAAPARSRGVVIALDEEVREGYRKDVAKGETAIEEGSLVENRFEDPKTTAQHPEDPFADDQGECRRLESVTTATSSEIGRVLESPLVRNPFSDPEERDPQPSPASGPSLTSSWKSGDRIQDYGFSNDEVDGMIIEARATAKSLWKTAAANYEQVLRMESKGFRGAMGRRSGGRYAELSGEE